MKSTTAPLLTARAMISYLMEEAGMSATQISDALDRRVSRRTIYRWAKGENDPQQSSDLVALNSLYEEKSA